MEGDQEAENKRAHCGLSANRLFPGLAGSLDIVGVKRIEDLQIFFIASGDVSMDDGCI
jgi:hypothetical protein